jgi:hypothetical protein
MSLPRHARYLVDQVVAHIVPMFEARGFQWPDGYAGGIPAEIGHNEIPLQRREGESWPTVQIKFDKRARPRFHIEFAAFPPICRRMFGTEEIPREKAIVAYAPAHFLLCRGKYKSMDGEFGHSISLANVLLFFPMLVSGLIDRDLHYTVNDIRFAVAPTRFLDSEVSEAVALLPILFDLFDQGIPEDWLSHDFGHVNKNVMLIGSWYLDARRRKSRGACKD